jgi:hypothetical protein
MKRFINISILFLFSIVLLVGCADNQDIGEGNTDLGTANPGITVNTIPFETLEVVPEEKLNLIEDLKVNRGYSIWQEGSDYYIFVSAGEKSSGGYSLEVIEVEDIEGVTSVIVEEKEPAQGDMTISVLTYPYTVIKVTNVADTFEIKNVDGDTYEFLDPDNIMGSEAGLASGIRLTDEYTGHNIYYNIIEDVPDDKKAFVDTIKEERGYTYWKEDGSLYVLILAGEKTSDNYALFGHAVLEDDDKVEIIVEEYGVVEDTLNKTAVTYPMLLLKIEDIENDFMIRNTEGDIFTYLGEK